MNSLDVPKFADLVRPDRVHRSLYVDPMLFELEMDRLFGRAWLVLGHESQVKAPGDFFTTRMARQPVLVTRDEGSAVRVLVNRCPHRGAVVCTEEHGHTPHFQCGYHGWTFACDGALKHVPMANAYP